MNEEIWSTFDAAFKDIRSLAGRVEELEKRVAQLEVENSTLRHLAGVTEVDELAEQLVNA